MLWTRDWGYQFCASEVELEEWERVWVSENLTAFRRMITGTLASHLALFPESRWANCLNTQIEAVKGTLEMAASQTG
ncbi:hypothetical protein ABZ614_43085 [Streptomyces sp. NPDC013178]|uniref:hypothetical protein n=1 Tax=unclassified Streptomyces TaxID=2593676 RepID=UPI0033DF6210